MISYLTDVEGRWEKIASFADGNPHVWLDGSALRLADGVTFVFGGDTIDRGPHGRRILATLVGARRDYGDRVVLLAGNRDLNKLRLVRELAEPPPGTTRGELLRRILATTMGAPRAFEHRATELAAGAGRPDDDAVVESFLDDVRPGGALCAYLHGARLAFRAGATLFVHGGVSRENFLTSPGGGTAGDVDGWIAALDRFYADELAAFAAGANPATLLAYQAPQPGTHLNQASVVYARPTDDDGNPHLPDPGVIRGLRAGGIERVVVGHTPSGDCPAVLRDDGFELVLGDNSYGRIELGSRLAFSDEVTMVDATAQLDDGTRVRIAYHSARADHRSPLGRRDRDTGQLVKAALGAGRYLLFRGLPEHEVEQLAVAIDEVDARRFVAAYAP